MGARVVKIAWVLIILASGARADTLVFKDGRQLEGVATTRGNKVELRVAEGLLFFSRDLIAQIRQGDTALQHYEKRRAALKDADAEGHFKLGQFCEKSNLRPQAAALFRDVIRVNPDHEGARERLGYRRFKGKWLTEDQVMAAKGMVRVGASWMTQEEAAEHEEKQLEAARELKEKQRAAAASAESSRLLAEQARKNAEATAANEQRTAQEAREKAQEAERKRAQESWGRFVICAKCSARVSDGERFCPSCHQFIR